MLKDLVSFSRLLSTNVRLLFYLEQMNFWLGFSLPAGANEFIMAAGIFRIGPGHEL